jgi:hypothetical protein
MYSSSDMTCVGTAAPPVRCLSSSGPEQIAVTVDEVGARRF